MRNSSAVQTKVSILFLVIVTLLLSAFGLYNQQRTSANRLATQSEQVDLALSRLATSLPLPLWNLDTAQVVRTLRSELGADFIDGMQVKNAGKVVAGVRRGPQQEIIEAMDVPTGAERERTIDLAYVEGNKSSSVGTLTLYVSERGIRAALHADLINQAIQIALLDAALLLALMVGLRGVVTRPLRQIGEMLKRIGSGDADLTCRLPTGGSMEFATIAEGFNGFVSKLQGVVESIRSHAVEVSTASDQIAKGTSDLSRRTEVQASELQQAASSMQHFSASVKLNAEHARQANRLALEATSVAERGGAAFSDAVQTMQAINEASKNIYEIVAVIDGIAFQTNILALNAAVEAARAGEQGRGFAVVAAEVRNLAQRSAVAAREVKALINKSVEQVQAGSNLVGSAGSTMQEVVGAIQQLKDVVAEISTASDSQSEGVSAMGDTVVRLDHVTQQNAALGEQGSAAAESMSLAAKQLVATVAVFGDSSAATSAVA